jgi:hypothetical protein
MACFIIRKDESIYCWIDELKKLEFNLKFERNMNEYLNFKMIHPHLLLTRLIQKFGEEIEGKRKFLTPSTPRFKTPKHGCS